MPGRHDNVDSGSVLYVLAESDLWQWSTGCVSLSRDSEREKERVMKICIPTKTNEGFDAKCGGDIRTARFFTVVDLDGDKLTVVPKAETPTSEALRLKLSESGAKG